TCDLVNGESKGSVIIDAVTGGTGPYNYYVTGTNGYAEQELNTDGSTSVKFNVVDFGLYQINVVDANGCSVLVQDVLVASPPDDLLIVVEPSADCINGGQAVVSIGTTLSGAGPFFFSIYQGPASVYPNPAGSWQAEDAVGSKTTTFTDLIPGVTYTFIVYDNSTGCSYYETAPGPIPTNSTLITEAFISNNISCKGSADGNVSFDIRSVYGSGITVSYEILNSQSLISTAISGTGTVPANGTLTVSNLGPLPFGNYYVLIKETSGPNMGCSIVTAPFNITESAIALSMAASVSKNENCNDLGILSATASNGTGPYEYQVVVSGATPVPSSWAKPNTFELAAGIYDVYVRDAYGCEVFETKEITKDAEPTLNPVAQVCFDGTPFSITLDGTTFNGIATYSIGGTYQSSPDFTITAAGTYIISIKDANNCIAYEEFIVAPPLLLDAVLDLDLTCTVDGSISLTASGGTGTYDTYEVSSDGGTTYTVITGTTYTATIEGTYIFKVTDSQGCEAVSNDIIVTPKTTPTLT
ncbi:MAG: chromophore lyase, partial [Gelidibacter sp.]